MSTVEEGAVAPVEEAKEQDVDVDVGGAAAGGEENKSGHDVRRLHGGQSSGMESSVLRFKDVNFVIGKGDKQKNILTDVSGTVKWGRKFVVSH
jgi:hypothetical protein